MALTDLSFPVTSKKIGPSATVLSRPKVYYLKSADIIDFVPDVLRSATILKLKTNAGTKKVEIYETPDEFLAQQSLAQGATATAVVTKAFAVLAPTASATGADGTVPQKYYNQIQTSVVGNYVRLPDPFVRRLVIIDNTTTGVITVGGRGTTSAIMGSTAPYLIQANERIHFLAPTAATAGTTAGWKTAVDVGA